MFLKLFVWTAIIAKAMQNKRRGAGQKLHGRRAIKYYAVSKPTTGLEDAHETAGAWESKGMAVKAVPAWGHDKRCWRRIGARPIRSEGLAHEARGPIFNWEMQRERSFLWPV